MGLLQISLQSSQRMVHLSILMIKAELYIMQKILVFVKAVENSHLMGLHYALCIIFVISFIDTILFNVRGNVNTFTIIVSIIIAIP